MSYATGKHALGICDRCGFQCSYLEMMKEWNGLKVCQECYEPKQPQLTPAIPRDVESLFEPRPEIPLPRAQLGSVSTTNQSAAGMTFKSDPIGSKFEGETATSALGSITVSTS